MSEDTPTTIEEAEKYRYGQWGGVPKGYAYKPDRCADEVLNGHLSGQCSRKNGHGTNGLFCKQHAKRYPA